MRDQNNNTHTHGHSRKLHIQKIKESLKDFALISKNKTMVEKKLNLQCDSYSQTSSNDGFSIQGEDAHNNSPFQHTELFAQKYETVGKLGEGSDGVVHKCIKKKTGKLYAAKAIMFEDQHVPLLRYNFMLMKGLHHKNIVNYEALYLDLKKHSCWLVMEFCPSPNLLRTIISSESQLRDIIQQLLQTLHYMHQRSVTHRDIKPQNILYDPSTKKFKLIDFGICRKFKRRGCRIDMLTITGTLFYRAPEMFSGGGYNEKIDIWATAITIYKLVTGRTPFESEYHNKTINNILNQEVSFPSVFNNYSPALKSLLTKMLHKNPKERPSALECLREVWFFANPGYNLPCTVHYSDESEQMNNEQELDCLRSPTLKMMDDLSFVRKINGAQYHCFDSDDDMPSHHMKRHRKLSKSLVIELNSLQL